MLSDSKDCEFKLSIQEQGLSAFGKHVTKKSNKSKSSEGFKVTRFLEVSRPPVSATNEIQVSVSIS